MKRHLLFVFFLLLLTTANAQSQTDSLAIQKLLERESATWRSGDIKGHADCWHIQPYSRILISTGDSTVLDIAPSVMMNPPAGMIGGGGYSINTKYKMSIGKTNAWVSHNEESVSKDGKHTYSYEIRILEKIKGQWKLVGQSIHIYRLLAG